jgi:quinoprotein glucose dehydrogenase
MVIYELSAARCCLFLLILIACDSKKTSTFNQWTAYAGGKEGNRYSSNVEINKQNVSRLRQVWTFSSRDKDPENRTQNQCNPIVINGTLYGTSPQLKLLALNAATGEVKWIFDPAKLDTISKHDPFAFYKVSRGVMFWNGDKKNEARIFYGVGSKVYAVNAANGSVVKDFGKKGYVDLGEYHGKTGPFNPYIALTTPGVIYQNLMIIGSRVAESADAAPGDIRAFDVASGDLVWTFHTIPRRGEENHESWEDTAAWEKLGGANSWAGLALDEVKGIVYVPTGSVSGDFYGGIRKGKNLYGNSLIALEARTGKYKWHYQVVHHDLWDRDLPANPNLVTVNIDGNKIDAVAQITKHGYIFIFDRVSGRPVFQINETPVPTTALPGEAPWPTQPIPVLPVPFTRQHFDSSMLSDLTPETHRFLMKKFRNIKHNQMFMPPSKDGGWIFPGFDGGGEWGGAAVDIETGIMFINSSELPWSLTMIDVPVTDKQTLTQRERGSKLYNRYCISCHAADLKGNGASFPSLVDIRRRRSVAEIESIIVKGKNMMPAFAHIKGKDLEQLIAFISDHGSIGNESIKKEPVTPEGDLPASKSILDEVPYTMTGYNRFLDQNGYPGIEPPWGTLNAINLNTGKLLWKVPLGEYKELLEKGMAPTGTENYGGPIVTRGGLVFIAATRDEKIRAFDKDTGAILWEATLPAAGYATPACYEINGKQYIVIACGGGKIGSKSGDQYVAFALPD